MAEETDPSAKDDNKKDDDQQEADPKETLGAAGKKALDEERKARRDAEKQAKDLAGRLKAIEDKDKSEVERLTGQVASLTKERDNATVKAERLEVAVLKALDEDRARRVTSAAKRITGATREELEADADEFLVSFPALTEEPRVAPSGKPIERLKSGGEPDAPVEETNLSKLGERMFSR